MEKGAKSVRRAFIANHVQGPQFSRDILRYLVRDNAFHCAFQLNGEVSCSCNPRYN